MSRDQSPVLRFQPAQDVLHARGAEAAVDHGAALGEAERRQRRRVFRHHGGPVTRDGGREIGQGRARHVVGGEPGMDRVGPAHPGASQGQEHAERVRQPRQEVARADIGKHADRGLRHRQQRGLADHADVAVHRDADAAAHAHAVDQRHVGFRVFGDRLIERVFLGEEGFDHVVLARQHVRADGAYVAARAERPLARTRDDDRMDLRLLAPCLQRVANGADHALVKGIQHVRAVERDPADAAVPRDQNGRFARHRRPAPVRPRQDGRTRRDGPDRRFALKCGF